MKLTGKIVIIVSTFNQKVTEKLLDGAKWKLYNAGLAEQDWEVIRVPGAFELPLAAQWATDREDCVGVVSLGCVIRGETPHFDFVCAESARGILEVSLGSSKPVIFGVLTTDTEQQAVSRAASVEVLEAKSRLAQAEPDLDAVKDAVDNKGTEAAQALLDMLQLKSVLRKQ
ncbi:MAG: 6,7-dimethyl-8-ribityllumazine synthase [Zetaproteobacteria bacterium]|nr:6,7-dimethyl-8-ribityllumazine synthase [Zetaproteobacteria bacterium]